MSRTNKQEHVSVERGGGSRLLWLSILCAWLAQFLPYVEVLFYRAILGAGIARETYRQARARELEMKSLEAQLQQARLQALRMQLQVTLEHEIDFIRRYFALEQLRFPDRLRVDIEIPAELQFALVPNLILQPLVENAIRHGVAQSSSAGLVRIVARRANQWLELFVQDDGIGLPNDWEQAPGIGLGNTQPRRDNSPLLR